MYIIMSSCLISVCSHLWEYSLSYKMIPELSPNNDARSFFPILNDRVFWRKIDYDPLIHRWYYGMHFRPEEFDKFHLNVFSSTDPKIKNMQGNYCLVNLNLYKKLFQVMLCVKMKLKTFHLTNWTQHVQLEFTRQ